MNSARVALTCKNPECGRIFTRYRSYLTLERRGQFCSRACQQTVRAKEAVEERVCEACGRNFVVGGRGRGLKSQRLCSDECQRLSRYRHGGRAKDLPSTDAAWLAGFLDGEGSIMLHGRKTAVALRLTATNTHRPTLDHIEMLCGVGKVLWQSYRQSERHKPSGWWLANGEAAETVIRQLLPYLVTKRLQAELAVSFQEKLRTPALKADRSWQAAALARMRRLNRRGPG